MTTLGGVHDSTSAPENSLEIDSLARFAVDQHNQKENAMLEFTRVVKAEEQVVAGTLHHLTLEAIDARKKKLYEAKIWVKPWMNFKELQEFKHAGDVPPFTAADLGYKEGVAADPAKTLSSNSGLFLRQSSTSWVSLASPALCEEFRPHCEATDQSLEKGQYIWSEVTAAAFHNLKAAMCSTPALAMPDFSKPFFPEKDASGTGIDGHPPGWQSVPVHDPVIQDAAKHAVKTIQQRSNSLFPYELREIIQAKAEVIEESAKFDMHLKVNRGGKEERFKVEVHKNNEGSFHLNRMEPI
ncbi:hypothetical protein RJ639_046697 [Escallonia herrerae]|uniref:Cysteine proteinase inhibitor n=1 Tax=Escallonia herrerae TaxID=1293975 RepID=A0AA88WA49_9ASTE|nr:hypothetical protein RJ639_046697 [Escallonia herrerae]